MSIDAFNDVMDQIASSGLFDIVAAGEAAPSEPEVSGLEKRLNFQFPADYREFLKHFGGFLVQAKAEVWPRSEGNEPVAAWRMQYGLAVLGIADGIPPFLDIEKALSEPLIISPQRLIPVLRWMGSPELYAYDPQGRFVRCSSQTPEKLDAVPAGFLVTFVRQLRELLRFTQWLQQNPNGGRFGTGAPLGPPPEAN
jgi:hypothetical protein